MLQKIGIAFGWIILVLVVVLIWLAVWYGMKFEIGTPEDSMYLRLNSFPLKRFF